MSLTFPYLLVSRRYIERYTTRRRSSWCMSCRRPAVRTRTTQTQTYTRTYTFVFIEKKRRKGHGRVPMGQCVLRFRGERTQSRVVVVVVLRALINRDKGIQLLILSGNDHFERIRVDSYCPIDRSRQDQITEFDTRGTFDMALAIKLLFIGCALLCMAMEGTAEGESGRSRVSEEQLNMALSDQRYLRRQLKCALGEAPCDPVGRRLKSLAPLVLRGSCPQCTPEETRQIKKVLSHIQRTYPKEWSKIVQQYAGVS